MRQYKYDLPEPLNVYAIVIKKKNGGMLVKFKKATKAKRLRKAVQLKLAGTGHTLIAVNFCHEAGLCTDQYGKKSY